MNAERILIAAECIGDGALVRREGDCVRVASASSSAGRSVRTRASSSRSPEAHAAIEAADLVRYKAAWLFEQGLPCGAEANMAKYLAAEASWEAANACLDTHGGFGFAEEYDVERKFRETRLYKVAPVSNNLILAYVGQHVLGMPRSYCEPDESPSSSAVASSDGLRLRDSRAGRREVVVSSETASATAIVRQHGLGLPSSFTYPLPGPGSWVKGFARPSAVGARWRSGPASIRRTSAGCGFRRNLHEGSWLTG